MANYNYDEAGNMAAYFLLTFILIVLVPFSLPSVSTKHQTTSGCDCQECSEHRIRLRKLERGSLLQPLFKKKTLFLLVGWSIFGYLAYKITTTEVEAKVYNPFEILGLSSGSTAKEIKSHYKKLSRIMHPDKVKLGVNETIEAVEARFVEVTKAYKSLTDETIRQNWEKYGHPDGRQEVSMGIALPIWIVQSKNNIWVLGAYGLIFGVALPGLVGKWWFGNRQKTKDGVNASSAASFFKSLNEDSGIIDVFSALIKSFQWEEHVFKSSDSEFKQLESQVKQEIETKWPGVQKFYSTATEGSDVNRKAFALLVAHILRIPVSSSHILADQRQVLLQTPVLLNSLLNICISRNWLVPTLAVMRLQAYIVQALVPGEESSKFAQLPRITQIDADQLVKEANSVDELIALLKEKGDDRVQDVQKAASKWGKLDLVDASFKVIDDRVVSPSSIVYLVVKARLTPPSGDVIPAVPESAAHDEERDSEFLNGRKDAEERYSDNSKNVWAHAPHWPVNRKPSWWIVLADAKSNRIVVPPMKITDVPYATPSSPEIYRSYKLQFQAPPNVQVFTWKLYVVSDTFVGEEVTRDVILRIEEAVAIDEEEDDISDPEEDSLAGQMAMMRGGAVKKRQDESDDESTTDGDEQSEDESSSSDSD
ncbi:hypothetical protein ABKN59_000029 [Abortiporus biennis]